VTVTLCAAAKLPLAAENVAAVVPDPTVTVVGTVKAGLLLRTFTIAFPAGAALLRVTVQVLDEFVLMVAGEQVSVETRTGATKLTVVFAELPLYVGVIVEL